MSNPKKSIDQELVAAADALFFDTPVNPRKAKRGLRSLPKARGSSAMTTRSMSAGDVREKLSGLARRVPEVTVKISGASTGMGRLRAHLSYISRNGQIQLEDQDGMSVEGRDELGELREDWRSGGFPIPEQGSAREALHLVLSMPAGTSELGLQRAVRDFAADEFGGHQYVMALHTVATDPDPQPSPHPHVHLTVKMRSIDGGRLNPRKGDLHRWRLQFAQALGDNGIEASATRRSARMQREPGEQQRVRQMKQRGVSPQRVRRRIPSGEAQRLGERSDAVVRGRWETLFEVLDRSEESTDKEFSRSLAIRFKLGSGRGEKAPEMHGPRTNGRDR